VWPIGGEPNAQAFFEAYLAAPIVLAFFLFWKILKRTRFVRPMDVDLISGRRDLNLAELKAQDLEEQSHWNAAHRYLSQNPLTGVTNMCRVYHWLC